MNFGDEAQDRISGFRGIIIGKYEMISGRVRVELQPRCREEYIESRFFDIEQVILVEPARFNYKIIPHGKWGES